MQSLTLGASCIVLAYVFCVWGILSSSGLHLIIIRLLHTVYVTVLHGCNLLQLWCTIAAVFAKRTIGGLTRWAARLPPFYFVLATYCDPKLSIARPTTAN